MARLVRRRARAVHLAPRSASTGGRRRTVVRTLGRPNTRRSACVQLLSHVVDAPAARALGDCSASSSWRSALTSTDGPRRTCRPRGGRPPPQKVYPSCPRDGKAVGWQEEESAVRRHRGCARSTARNSARNSRCARRGGAQSHAERRGGGDSARAARRRVGVVGGGEHVTSFETFIRLRLGSHSLRVSTTVGCRPHRALASPGQAPFAVLRIPQGRRQQTTARGLPSPV